MKRRYLSFIIPKIYTIFILFFYVIFALSIKNRSQNKEFVVRHVCSSTVTIAHPIDPKLIKLSSKYLALWKPFYKESLVTNTTVYKGINIKSLNSTLFTDANISLITKTIDELPQVMINFRPLNIILVTPETLSYYEPQPTQTAMTSGPNIYLLPSTFKDGNNVSFTLFHEWTHVVQYYKAIGEPLTQNRFYQLQFPKLVRGGAFVHDYAVKVGWDNPNTQSWLIKKDLESQKQTSYGKTLPEEDQAETVALFLTDNQKLLSSARITWAKGFLECN